MKYLPRKSSEKGTPSISFYDEPLLKMVRQIDPDKLISKYEDFHSGTSIGFFDEDGFEYRVVVGTKTAPITEAMVKVNVLNIMEFSSPELHEKFTNDARDRVGSFVDWLKRQGVSRISRGD